VTGKVQTFATINLRDAIEVPDFNKARLSFIFFMGPLTHYIMTDLGAGNNNMFCWTMDNKQESIDIIDHGASKRRDLTVSPK
ncbi:thioredoxin-like protein 4a, partial [Lactarius indigo]